MSSIFTALSDRRQFVLCRARDKCPVDTDGRNSDAQDSSTWMFPAEALAWALVLGEGYGVGIVLYEGCGIGCIDVDNALQDDGTWSLTALALCNRFKGAYIEVSLSGRGLHIFFRCGTPPPHSTKNIERHIEFYTTARYIALTGTNAIGDITFDASGLVPELVRDFFQPKQDAVDADWTTEPHEDWNGPEDDDALLAIMLRSSSAKAKFGKGVTFSDLWNNNVDKLAQVWPSSTGDEYDRSSADQAIANHLSFYTGAHAERMHTLMLASGLARSKWERPGYLSDTILKACGWQTEFYSSGRPQATVPAITGPAQVPPVPSEPSTAQVVGTGTEHGETVTSSAQQLLFKGCVGIQDINKIMLPEGHEVKREQFENDPRFSGRTYLVTPDGSRPTDSAWDCFQQSKIVQFPKVRGSCFDPREAPSAILLRGDDTLVNTWRPLSIASEPGDVSLYVDHIRKLFPNGDDSIIYLSFVSACIQYPGVKAAWALFIQGLPGIGKGFLTTVLTYCLGAPYVHAPNAATLDRQFNGWLYRKLLICVEEIMVTEGRTSTWEKLKCMITELRQEIESKGMDQITREVCCNFIFNSNHKDGLRKTEDDRRICPLYTAQQSISDLVRDGMRDGMENEQSAYFDTLWSWFYRGGAAHILHYLRNFEIPDKYNFALEKGGARRAPRTTSTPEALQAGLGTVEQEVMEAIRTGREGFRGGWISSYALDTLAASTAMGRNLSRNKRRQVAESLGYMLHEGLPGGRLSEGITGSPAIQPQIYVRVDHSSRHLTEQGLIRQLYEAAQKQ